jgi:hypothetical protein
LVDSRWILLGTLRGPGERPRPGHLMVTWSHLMSYLTKSGDETVTSQHDYVISLS